MALAGAVTLALGLASTPRTRSWRRARRRNGKPPSKRPPGSKA